MGERCAVCDREACPADAARVEVLRLSGRDKSWLTPDVVAAQGRLMDAAADCGNHEVNWRTRALAAEAEVKRPREGLARVGCLHMVGEQAAPCDDWGKPPDRWCPVCRALQGGESDGPACPDHWHCAPARAAHGCDQPDRTRPCPTCGVAPAVQIAVSVVEQFADQVREVLAKHYLAGLATLNDSIRCGCGTAHLTVDGSVGELIDSWVDHVMEEVERAG